MAADMDWEGIMPDRSVMTATTHHTWVIVDDPKERFARIKSVDVAVTRPLAPKP